MYSFGLNDAGQLGHSQADAYVLVRHVVCMTLVCVSGLRLLACYSCLHLDVCVCAARTLLARGRSAGCPARKE